MQYTGVYQGIDITYSGTSANQVEYQFTVQSGADPDSIRLNFQGAQSVHLDSQGNLDISTSSGTVTQSAPTVYQEINGVQQDVSGQFVLNSDGSVGFQVGSYNTADDLIIDPALGYQTYLGSGGNNTANAVAVNQTTGDAYVAGGTTAANLSSGVKGPWDASVIRITPAGVIYKTYLGGADTGDSTTGTQALGIAVGSDNNVYVVGSTYASDFPTTASAINSTYGGAGDGFLAVLNAAGDSLLYSTYLGGIGWDQATSVAVDAQDQAHITGVTSSPSFLNTSPEGSETAFVLVVDPWSTGQSLVSSTLLTNDGTASYGRGIAVDANGDSVVVGNVGTPAETTGIAISNAVQPDYAGGADDAFVSVVPVDSSSTADTTYLGGSGDDIANGVAVENGNIYVTGSTTSADFPTTDGAFLQTLPAGQHAFVTELTGDLTSIVYSTLLGGSCSDVGQAIAVNAEGQAVVTGQTQSADFPVLDPVQGGMGGGDAFVTELLANGAALGYSSYLGGSGEDSGNGIALDAAGSAYVAGVTNSTNLPTTSNAMQGTFGGSLDAFLSYIEPGASSLPQVTIAASEPNAADGTPVTPGQFVLTRTGDTSQALTVDYTVGGTASTQDYVETFGGTATFAAGASTCVLSLTPRSTLADGGTHTVTLTLAGNAAYTISGARSATVTIQDVNEPTLNIAGTTVNEVPGGTVDANFVVSLSAAPSQPVTVSYGTADGTAFAGTNYVATSGTLMFNPGEPLTQDISVPVTDGLVYEGNTTFSVILSNASNATIVDSTANFKFRSFLNVSRSS